MVATFNFALEKATRERDKFLEEHPELQSFQDDLRSSFDDFEDDPLANMEIIKNAMEVNYKKLMNIGREVDRDIKNWGLHSDTVTETPVE